MRSVTAGVDLTYLCRCCQLLSFSNCEGHGSAGHCRSAAICEWSVRSAVWTLVYIEMKWEHQERGTLWCLINEVYFIFTLLFVTPPAYTHLRPFHLSYLLCWNSLKLSKWVLMGWCPCMLMAYFCFLFFMLWVWHGAKKKDAARTKHDSKSGCHQFSF